MKGYVLNLIMGCKYLGHFDKALDFQGHIKDGLCSGQKVNQNSGYWSRQGTTTIG